MQSYNPEPWVLCPKCNAPCFVAKSGPSDAACSDRKCNWQGKVSETPVQTPSKLHERILDDIMREIEQLAWSSMIRVEMQIPPHLLRDRTLWMEIEELAGTKNVRFRSDFDAVERKTIITATDDAGLVGKAEIPNTQLSRHKQDEVLMEAMRFAAWKLIHGDEEVEDDDDQGPSL